MYIKLRKVFVHTSLNHPVYVYFPCLHLKEKKKKLLICFFFFFFFFFFFCITIVILMCHYTFILMCNCFVFVAYSTNFFYYEVKQTRRPSGHQATNNGLSLHLVAFLFCWCIFIPLINCQFLDAINKYLYNLREK